MRERRPAIPGVSAKDSDFAADGRNRQLEVVLAMPLIRTVRALLLMKWRLLVVILEVNSLISTV